MGKFNRLAFLALTVAGTLSFSACAPVVVLDYNIGEIEETGSGTQSRIDESFESAIQNFDLGYDLKSLKSAGTWLDAAYGEDSAPSTVKFFNAVAEGESLESIVAWIDSQDWSGWQVYDTEPGQAILKTRHHNDGEFVMQEIRGTVVTVDLQFRKY